MVLAIIRVIIHSTGASILFLIVLLLLLCAVILKVIVMHCGKVSHHIESHP